MAHVKGYTRKDGSFVKEHDDKRAAAKPETGHPHVVGKIADHKFIGSGGKGEAPGNGDPTHPSTTSFGFGGRTYSPTGKKGASMHDQTPVHEFEAEDGHRVWADKTGRVHADSTDEVEKLRELGADHAKPEEQPYGDEPGDYERHQYGVYHAPGSKAKDAKGNVHTIASHSGPEVYTDKGERFHPTKLTPVEKGGKSSPLKGGKSPPLNGGKKAPGQSWATLKKHPMHSESDLAYFKAKGYSPDEIKEIWDRDHKAGHKPVVHNDAPDVVGALKPGKGEPMRKAILFGSAAALLALSK